MVWSLLTPTIAALLATILTIGGLHLSNAQVMQSGSYRIQSDSLNIGGLTSTSSNYNLRSTVGEVATGVSDSETFSARAGFQQMQEVYIALTGAQNIIMDTAIPAVTGDESNGSTTVTVTTDSPSGYALTLVTENNPAMQKGVDSIANYAPGTNPSLNFNYSDGEAFFGFTPEGADIVSRFRDNGGTCGTGGSLDTAFACWDGVSTTPETIASDTSANHPDGATTTIRFRVGVGAQTNLVPGIYIATTTVTAIPL